MPHPSEFEGRIAVVTGASSGIGKATAEMLVSRGARVVVFARSAEKLRAITDGHANQMVAVAGDVSDHDAVDRLFSVCEATYGDCDLLVNNAGMIHPKSLLDTTAAEWDRLIAVNLRGVYLASRRALGGMTARRGGVIVNVASISGVPGPEKFPGYVSYCASKAAVIAFTEALAVEVRDAGIRVNCISPGAVDTPMWEEASGGSRASMTPEEVAEAILFLASERSRPMNGQNLHVFSS